MEETTTTAAPAPVSPAPVAADGGMSVGDVRTYWRMYTTDPTAQAVLGCRFQAENDHHVLLVYLFTIWTIILIPVAIIYHVGWIAKKRKTMAKYRAYLAKKGITPDNYKPYNYN